MLRMLQIAAAALVLALAPAAHAQKEREVSIALQAAITSIDPHYHNLSPNNGLLLHVFEPLVKRDHN
jgi:peptide/nickel transport system substrate-binding protein